MLNKHINNATISEGTLLLAQPAASCASRTSRRRAGFHSPLLYLLHIFLRQSRTKKEQPKGRERGIIKR